MDLEVDSRSAPFAHTAVLNAPDNIEIFNPCQPVDLWTRTQQLWHSKLHQLKIRPVNVHVDALCSPEKVMDVSDVKMCETQPLHPDTDAPFEERVSAVPEESNLHFFRHARCRRGTRHLGNIMPMCQRVFLM